MTLGTSKSPHFDKFFTHHGRRFLKFVSRSYHVGPTLPKFGGFGMHGSEWSPSGSCQDSDDLIFLKGGKKNEISLFFHIALHCSTSV